MKAIIFAGGAGTRLWPLSRKKSPKQFEKIIGDKSTLQLAVERLYPDFKPEDIFLSTNAVYKDIIVEQLPEVPKENFIFEPEKKDVGPAVALAMGMLLKKGINEPVVILWSDHIVKKDKRFKQIIAAASEYTTEHPNKIVFIGHTPRFASQNLGWIHYGNVVEHKGNVSLHSFEGFKYRPDPTMAEEYFHSGRHAWNLGYFVTTPKFIYDAFKRFAPSIHESVERILAALGTDKFEAVYKKEYSKIESISFDNAILEQLDKKEALVSVDDIGWSDVGAWEALKEALENFPGENITKGKVYLTDSKDTLVYNYDEKKLIVGIDLDELLVVDTKDVLLVAKKTSVPKIKKVVESFAGTENEILT
ncbi:MAG: sugar phosphate nucleotidyltransferase [Patescibacteria group bacterium]|jgi:mannose-1-phosphate guanylyltransferase